MGVLLLWVELVVLFVGVPFAIRARLVPRQPILALLIASALCAAYLLRDPAFDRARLWNAAGARADAVGALLGFVASAAAVIGLVAWRAPDRLFDLPRRRPRLWILIMTLYPLLSVYPQELVYRAFFFHRYAPILPGAGARVVVGAGLFALGHVFFPRPWVAVSLTFVGGLLFSYHYEVSGSLLLVSIEHSLFGQLMFTVGLGSFFYAGGSQSTSTRS